jgi:alpha-amylase/alpha-mannosidase (GH57 family)
MSSQLAVLLHMHQPDYRDPQSGAPGMPWVRLHALRGYLDVATIALERAAPLTINVVPSLLDQLLYYAGGGTDRWEELSRRRAEDLDADEIAFVRGHFVHGHPAMRRASPRYQSLEARLQAGEVLDARALRDLQVWSNLAWIGFVGAREPLVRHLRARDAGFDHDELLALMDLQQALLARVLPTWRKLPHLSCSPSFHPILPLLVDHQHARRSDPDLPAPDARTGVDFRYPEDALRQLVEGRARVNEVLGVLPDGLWPSEGALSPEAAELVTAAGFRWAMADQALLERSDRDAPADVRRPWRTSDGLALLFRDRDLSDRIGFRYQYWDAAAAVHDLLGAAGAQGIVPIALDGENPWEAYPDAGAGFLEALCDSGRLVSVGEAVAAPGGRIHRLHTGSWINGDLRIWAGAPEDRAGWSLLASARRAWDAVGRPDEAWHHLAAAEGSDWFWWFGPEFSTENHHLFDGLFRGHLRAAWRAMGLEPPASLFRPVGAEAGAVRHCITPPILPITPDPASWEGAAPLELPRQGAMAVSATLLRGGLVGADAQHIYLRLDLPLMRLEPPPGSRLRVDCGELGALELNWAGVVGGPVTVPAGEQGAMEVAVWDSGVLVRMPRPRHIRALQLRVERLRVGGATEVIPPSGWLVVELPSAPASS